MHLHRVYLFNPISLCTSSMAPEVNGEVMPNVPSSPLVGSALWACMPDYSCRRTIHDSFLRMLLPFPHDLRLTFANATPAVAQSTTHFRECYSCRRTIRDSFLRMPIAVCAFLMPLGSVNCVNIRVKKPKLRAMDEATGAGSGRRNVSKLKTRRKNIMLRCSASTSSGSNSNIALASAPPLRADAPRRASEREEGDMTAPDFGEADARAPSDAYGLSSSARRAGRSNGDEAAGRGMAGWENRRGDGDGDGGRVCDRNGRPCVRLERDDGS
eukprot:TRINITY_DN3880_c0_g1_i1.p1 TRINITY_DN3880_c0_g1~~TRINITY_DN3880_c0_g1_i1.p1  ORF type:complete len:270 (-),score=-16.95 TRINITY_DN3880_c0_g1_i1:225-1034(-)